MKFKLKKIQNKRKCSTYKEARVLNHFQNAIVNGVLEVVNACLNCWQIDVAFLLSRKYASVVN